MFGGHAVDTLDDVTTEERGSTRDPDLVRAVGQGVAAARKAAGHSRPDFAALLGWSEARLVDVELGRRETRLADLERVCGVLSLGLADVLAETERGRRAAEALRL